MLQVSIVYFCKYGLEIIVIIIIIIIIILFFSKAVVPDGTE